MALSTRKRLWHFAPFNIKIYYSKKQIFGVIGIVSSGCLGCLCLLCDFYEVACALRTKLVVE